MTDADLTRRARVEAWNGWIDDHRSHGSVTRELMAAWDAAWTAASAALSAELAEAKAEVERLRKNRNECHRAEVHYLRRLTDAETERDEARAALAALREQYRDLATYRTTHANLGLCPEGPDDPARDPDCPVCAAVSAAAPDERGALDVEADEARAALAALREGIEEFAAAREQALPGLVRQLRALVAAPSETEEGRASLPDPECSTCGHIESIHVCTFASTRCLMCGCTAFHRPAPTDPKGATR